MKKVLLLCLLLGACATTPSTPQHYTMEDTTGKHRKQPVLNMALAKCRYQINSMAASRPANTAPAYTGNDPAQAIYGLTATMSGKPNYDGLMQDCLGAEGWAVKAVN